MFFGSLFLWYVRLGKYHRVIVFLMLCGRLDAYDDVRVEELGFEDSKPYDMIVYLEANNIFFFPHTYTI